MQMSHLAAPDAPAAPAIAQPMLRAGDERCSLAPGIHGLGGRAPDAIQLAALESQPRAALLSVSADGVTVLQRTTASVMVRIDGEIHVQTRSVVYLPIMSVECSASSRKRSSLSRSSRSASRRCVMSREKIVVR